MRYFDRIYGSHQIKEPVLIELINSPSIQRLKQIDQGGHVVPFFGKKGVFSRFEHSMGVFLLLRIYRTPLEEQIAGLIHDVSHSAFSHCVDYVLKEGSPSKHNHQDNIFSNFVLASEIPAILTKHQIDPHYILNEKNFPLKENEIPDICADRIDYCLRQLIIFEIINSKQLNYFLNQLVAENNQWIFKDFKSAFDFAQNFSYLNQNYWAHFKTANMFQTVGDYIAYALSKKIINKKDLYTTNQELLDKTKNHLDKDSQLRLLYNRMNNKIKAVNDPKNYDHIIVCKSRAVNPFCQHKGEIKRVSEIDKNWRKVVKKELKPKEYYLRFKG